MRRTGPSAAVGEAGAAAGALAAAAEEEGSCTACAELEPGALAAELGIGADGVDAGAEYPLDVLSAELDAEGLLWAASFFAFSANHFCLWSSRMSSIR